MFNFIMFLDRTFSMRLCRESYGCALGLFIAMNCRGDYRSVTHLSSTDMVCFGMGSALLGEHDSA